MVSEANGNASLLTARANAPQQPFFVRHRIAAGNVGLRKKRPVKPARFLTYIGSPRNNGGMTVCPDLRALRAGEAWRRVAAA